MSNMSNIIRKKLRNAKDLSTREFSKLLNELRHRASPTNFLEIITAIKSLTPKHYRLLVSTGTKSPASLMYERFALTPLSFVDELRWGSLWLNGQQKNINPHRNIAEEIQDHLLNGDYKHARELLENQIENFGWTIWAVELYCALEQLLGGSDRQRQWAENIQRTAQGAPISLLLEIFSDRNDETFSYDAFMAKCNNSLIHFDGQSRAFADYLRYRSLNIVSDPEKALPNLLAFDATSNLIDYYESFIAVLSSVTTETSLTEIQQLAREIVAELIEDGFTDYRLKKILTALGGNGIARESSNQSSSIERISDAVYSQNSTSDVNDSELTTRILTLIQECKTDDVVPYEKINELMKLGANLKSLPLGEAIGFCNTNAATTISHSPIVSIGLALLSPTQRLDDVCSMNLQNGLNYLSRLRDDHGRSSEEAELICRAIKSDSPECNAVDDLLSRIKSPSLSLIWLGQQLLASGKYYPLIKIINRLKASGSSWCKHAARLEALQLSAQGKLNEVLTLAYTWITKDPQFAHELQLKIVFENRHWQDWKDLDPVLVGIISHFTARIYDSRPIAYICKMCCRYVMATGLRERLVEEYQAASTFRKEQLIAFLRSVWIEENLTLCHQFDSSDSVRSERMRVLQLLHEWDREDEDEYVEAIKYLTFEQTLSNGLRQIDRSRIFVNEAAITRWAEKEILPDFDRWRRLSESDGGSRIVDETIRQYALDPTNQDILKDATSGKPTATDILALELFDRLYRRFLRDPTDGLDCYLSLRIRHGSLRGTILGPLEEQGLLYSNSAHSQNAFRQRWEDSLHLQPEQQMLVTAALEKFSTTICRLVTELVDERVQIHKPDKPSAAFKYVNDPNIIRLFFRSLAGRPITFHSFLNNCYFVFWKLVELGLVELQEYVRVEFKSKVQECFDHLISDLRTNGQRTLLLITTITATATETQSQCDAVAQWFQRPQQAAGETYKLSAAIEIARTATCNVHRRFRADIIPNITSDIQLPLTTGALAILTDCLFVIFENAWKHSGLGEKIGKISVHTTFSNETNNLSICVKNQLSHGRKTELASGELTALRKKYLDEWDSSLVSTEGGSGFPKLRRLTRSTEDPHCNCALDFGLDADGWFTKVNIPLYERDGAYEAYEQ